MSTIQIRSVPDWVHRRYQSRAAAAGMSLQEYLRAELIRNSEFLTPAEIAAQIEDQLKFEGSDGFSLESAGELIRADRDSH